MLAKQHNNYHSTYNSQKRESILLIGKPRHINLSQRRLMSIPAIFMISRMPVSRALKELQAFVVDKQSEDYLLIGFANSKLNPYREKNSCTLT